MHLNPFNLAFNMFCHLTSFLLTLVNVGFQLGLLTLLKKKNSKALLILESRLISLLVIISSCSQFIISFPKSLQRNFPHKALVVFVSKPLFHLLVYQELTNHGHLFSSPLSYWSTAVHLHTAYGCYYNSRVMRL